MVSNTHSPTTHLLYLHGFRSSPQSAKAQKVARRVREKHPEVVWWCPQLPPSPALAMQMLLQGTADWPARTTTVIGSSLGGFYARGFCLQKNCRAALFNPAVYPARDLAQYIGEQTTWHDPEEHFFFQPEFVTELIQQQSTIERLSPLHPATAERLFAIVAKGDEVLDWREMLGFCQGGTVRLLPGGDHAISDFDDHMDALFEFLNLAG
ncbi:esterase [Hydrogenophaga crassostreae]|uniref:Esterase n=1 Tax=Hydrogenophaga crassostreae TaxID=1763535 RepID=A0A162SXY2_9BURK|nr:YqiA/YcfP family alpha/beta fold hydrolase [Hydrogenophaga crassostreae]AOW15875.1 esterase [Hydrogenophaga crassostreae]OAD41525.1 esterase [Hydrogenophaga crassostreae]